MSLLVAYENFNKRPTYFFRQAKNCLKAVGGTVQQFEYVKITDCVKFIIMLITLSDDNEIPICTYWGV